MAPSTTPASHMLRRAALAKTTSSSRSSDWWCVTLTNRTGGGTTSLTACQTAALLTCPAMSRSASRNGQGTTASRHSLHRGESPRAPGNPFEPEPPAVDVKEARAQTNGHSGRSDRHPQTRRLDGRHPVEVDVGTPLRPRRAHSPAPGGETHVVQVPRPTCTVHQSKSRATHDPGLIGLDAGVGPVVGRDILQEPHDPVESKQSALIGVAEAHHVVLGKVPSVVAQGNELDHDCPIAGPRRGGWPTRSNSHAPPPPPRRSRCDPGS